MSFPISLFDFIEKKVGEKGRSRYLQSLVRADMEGAKSTLPDLSLRVPPNVLEILTRTLCGQAAGDAMRDLTASANQVEALESLLRGYLATAGTQTTAGPVTLPDAFKSPAAQTPRPGHTRSNPPLPGADSAA